MTEKELQLLKKRLIELAEKSYGRGIYTYTPFLSLAEQQAFYAVEKEIAYAGYAMEGGAADCERKMIRFGNKEITGYEEAYPITALEIVPLQPKFADELTHRDYLGALMNLGIERGLLGDLFPEKTRCILFCQQSIAPYLAEQLYQVKHTSVKCLYLTEKEPLAGKEPEEVVLTAVSTRVDSIVAKLYHISRTKSQELFLTGRIYVNGIAMESGSYQLKKDDMVTVRGHGRFICFGIIGENKKGKERISIGVFR